MPGGTLAALARLAVRRPRALLLAGAAASLAALLPLAHVRFETDVTRLLPQDDARVRAFVEAKDLVQEPGAVWALFELRDGAPAEALPAAVEAWAASVAAARDAGGRPLVRAVEWRAPERYERFVREILSRYGFLYLDGADLDEALARLEPEAIRAAVAQNRARLGTAAPAPLSRALAQDPLGLNALFARRFAAGLGGFELDPMAGYLRSRDGRAALARVVGDRPPGDVAYAHALMDAFLVAEAGIATVRVGYAGAYMSTVAAERSIRRDIWLTFGSSFVAVIAIFVYAFRRKRALAFAAVPLAAGLLWTFSLVAAASGAIGVATTGFASVVVGLAVDYSIHVTSRYVVERRAGADAAAAVERALVSSGGGIVPAALMTIAAFLTFLFTSFRGLAELGALAAAGMAVTLVATFWLLPPLLALTGPRHDESRPMATFGLGRVWDAIAAAPRAVLAASAFATIAAALVLALAPGPALRLETDIRKLLPSTDRTAEVQDGIARRFGVPGDVVVALARAPDEDAALARLRAFEPELRRLKDAGAIAGWDAPSRYLPPRAVQEAALARLRTVDRGRALAALREALAAEGFRASAMEGSLARLDESLRPPGPVTRETLERAGLAQLLAGLRPAAPGEPAAALATILPRTPGAALALESAAPPGVVVTGITTVVRVLVGALESDVLLATLAAAAAVCAISLVHFRRPGPAALAALPVFPGFLWMLAAMKLLDLPVNFMNVIVFPMVIGIDDNAVHIVHRWRELGAAPGALRRALDDIGVALFLCTATTALGFGSLVLSENPGLASIGAATILGKLTTFAASTIALPAWLALAERRPGAQNASG